MQGTLSHKHAKHVRTYASEHARYVDAWARKERNLADYYFPNINRCNRWHLARKVNIQLLGTRLLVDISFLCRVSDTYGSFFCYEFWQLPFSFYTDATKKMCSTKDPLNACKKWANKLLSNVNKVISVACDCWTKLIGLVQTPYSEQKETKSRWHLMWHLEYHTTFFEDQEEFLCLHYLLWMKSVKNVESVPIISSRLTKNVKKT